MTDYFGTQGPGALAQGVRQTQEEKRETAEAQTLRIAPSVLQPGDIIATASNTFNSRAIRAATRAQFSHAILYRGGGWAIDAIPNTGATQRLLEIALKETSRVVVFRHRTATREQRELAAKWAARAGCEVGSSAGQRWQTL